MTGRRPPLGGHHYSKIWHLALPLILANLTVPLLGMVDTAVIGNLSAAHIGSVALSSMIFSFLFWSLAFIRFSATGLTAQAYGADTPDEVFTVLSQTLGVSVIFGTIFIVAEQPIISLSLFLSNVSFGQNDNILFLMDNVPSSKNVNIASFDDSIKFVIGLERL